MDERQAFQLSNDAKGAAGHESNESKDVGLKEFKMTQTGSTRKKLFKKKSRGINIKENMSIEKGH